MLSALHIGMIAKTQWVQYLYNHERFFYHSQPAKSFNECISNTHWPDAGGSMGRHTFPKKNGCPICQGTHTIFADIADIKIGANLELASACASHRKGTVSLKVIIPRYHQHYVSHGSIEYRYSRCIWPQSASQYSPRTGSPVVVRTCPHRPDIGIWKVWWNFRQLNGIKSADDHSKKFGCSQVMIKTSEVRKKTSRWSNIRRITTVRTAKLSKPIWYTDWAVSVLHLL